ncbi:MAG: GNAT family N-acetyltransferase, partial [Candidatus Omnitrophica bacterium]|nr:GNAT family N-acetyltransferase [Candidatus Omnitrophota bacterium]
KDVRKMECLMRWWITPRFVTQAFLKGEFFKAKHFCLLKSWCQSCFRGEFRTPDFHREYPALLHINFEQSYRGQGLGSRLINHFLEYLRGNKVVGVQAGTMSEEAKQFFLKQGFKVIFQGRRSYLRYHMGHDTPAFILGKRIFFESEKS